MEYRKVTAGDRDVADLYTEAFPPVERIPLRKLIRRGYDFEGAYEGEELVGLYCTVPGDGMTFLFYLAVRKDLRGRGYGSEILRKVCEDSSVSVVLNIEYTGEDTPEDDGKLRRKVFYLRNGFTDSGYVLEDEQGRFNVLSDGEFDAGRYSDLLSGIGRGIILTRAPP